MSQKILMELLKSISYATNFENNGQLWNRREIPVPFIQLP